MKILTQKAERDPLRTLSAWCQTHDVEYGDVFMSADGMVTLMLTKLPFSLSCTESDTLVVAVLGWAGQVQTGTILPISATEHLLFRRVTAGLVVTQDW